MLSPNITNVQMYVEIGEHYLEAVRQVRVGPGEEDAGERGLGVAGVAGVHRVGLPRRELVIHVQDVGDQGAGLHLLAVQLLHLLLHLDCLHGNLLPRSEIWFHQCGVYRVMRL